MVFLVPTWMGRLITWTYDGISKLAEHPALQSFINYISLSPFNNKMLIGYENKQLILGDQISNEIHDIQLKGNTNTITAASWSNDGNYLATGGNDSLIIIWSTTSGSGEPVKILKGTSGIRDLTFCNADSLISAHDDGSIYLRDLKNSTSELLYPPSGEKPLCLAWDRSRGNLLAGTSGGTILFFNLSHKSIEPVKYASHTTGIDQLIFNKDFSMVATAAWDKTIRIYNYHEFFDLHNFIRGVISIENLDSRTRSLIFTSDNKLVAGMADKSIRLWETSPAEACFKDM